MSSSAPGGSGPPPEKAGLSRFMRRASKALKGGSKKSSSSSIASPAEGDPGTRASTSRQPAPLPDVDPTGPVVMSPPVVSPSAPPPAPIASSSPKPTVSPTTVTQSKPKGQPGIQEPPARTPQTASESYKLQEERARALFTKYGLTLEPGEWTSPSRGDSERVEKKVRMRVHRRCHRCQTTFGPEKICLNCQHTRCKKCPRYPTKGPKDPLQMTKPATGFVTIPASAISSVKPSSKARSPRPLAPFNPAYLTMPSKSVDGSDLIRKANKQRVRRMCHKCDSAFIGKSNECSVCHHHRCAICPRDP